MSVSRRQFVQTLLLAPTALIGRRLDALLGGGLVLGGETTRRAHHLACCVRESGSARVLGRVYLASGPSEATLETLVPRLWPAGVAMDGGPAIEAAGLRKALAERSRADFAAGRIVSVDGWLLSETEGRLCAVMALLPRSTSEVKTRYR